MILSDRIVLESQLGFLSFCQLQQFLVSDHRPSILRHHWQVFSRCFDSGLNDIILRVSGSNKCQ